MSTVCAEVFNDNNYGKTYKAAQELADDMNIVLAEPKFHSDTRFANNANIVFKIFYTDNPVFINHYENIIKEKEDSNVQREKSKVDDAKSKLKQIKCKSFFLESAGTVDIYSNLSDLVNEQQTVNLLPYERFDLFERQMKKLHNMKESLNDQFKCGDSNCD